MNLRRMLLAGVCLLLGVVLVQADDQQRGKPGKEVNAKAAKGERYNDTLKMGAPAPDFTLPDPTGKKQVTLSSFQGKKPVVLIFGSCT